VTNRDNSNIIGKAVVWVSLSKYNAKSIGQKYWYLYCQYVFAAVLVLLLAILLKSIVNNPVCEA